MSTFLQLKSIQQPTAVYQCVKANFIKKDETNLIVSLSTCLQIYSIHEREEIVPFFLYKQIFPLTILL